MGVATLREAWRLRSLVSGWLATDDWNTEAVDAVAAAALHGGPNADVANADVAIACARLGQSRARAGISIGETIEDLAALFAVLDDGSPPLRLVSSLAEGWVEEGLARHSAGCCEDPLTGLVTVPFLRTRLAELYREAEQLSRSPADTHRLVTIRLSREPDPWHRMAQAILVGHDLRAAFPGGDTVCGVVSGPAIALVRSRADLPARYQNLRRAVRRTCGARIEIAPLPALLTEALRLVDELAH
jgi:hypothetical protein